MLTVLLSAVGGAVAFGFFLRNNPKWVIKLLVAADKIVEYINSIKEAEKAIKK